MKNIILITIMTLVLGQAAWAQKTDKPTDHGKREGIGGRTNGSNEKNRKAIRGSSGSEVSEKIKSSRLSNEKGRCDAGRPEHGGGDDSKKGGTDEKKRPNLREIIKKELQLTEEQMKKLHAIHSKWHEAVKEIKGDKKFIVFKDLGQEAKNKLLAAWRRLDNARREILTDEQQKKLREIFAKRRKLHQEKKKQNASSKKEEGNNEGQAKRGGGREQGGENGNSQRGGGREKGGENGNSQRGGGREKGGENDNSQRGSGRKRSGRDKKA